MRIGGAVSVGGRRRAAHKNGASHRQAVGALLHEVVRARSTRAAAAVGRSCATALAAVSTAIARLGGLDARGAVADEKAARRPNAAPAAGIPTARPISLAPCGAAHVRTAASTAAAAATAASTATTTTTTARIAAPAAPATAPTAVAAVAAVTAVRSGPGRDVRRERAVRGAEQLLRAAARAVAAAPEQRERRELQALGQLLVGFCGPNHSSVSGQSFQTKRFVSQNWRRRTDAVRPVHGHAVAAAATLGGRVQLPHELLGAAEEGAAQGVQRHVGGGAGGRHRRREHEGQGGPVAAGRGGGAEAEPVLACPQHIAGILRRMQPRC